MGKGEGHKTKWRFGSTLRVYVFGERGRRVGMADGGESADWGGRPAGRGNGDGRGGGEADAVRER